MNLIAKTSSALGLGLFALTSLAGATLAQSGSTPTVIVAANGACDVNGGSCLRLGDAGAPDDHALLVGTGNDWPFKSDGSGMTGDGVVAYGQGHIVATLSADFYSPQLRLHQGYDEPKDPLPFSVSWIGSAGWQSNLSPNAYGFGLFAGATGILGGQAIQDALHSAVNLHQPTWQGNARPFAALAGFHGWASAELASVSTRALHVGLDASAQTAFGVNIALARADLGLALQPAGDEANRLPLADGLNGFSPRDVLARGVGVSVSGFVKGQGQNPAYVCSLNGPTVTMNPVVYGARVGGQLALPGRINLRVDAEISTPYYKESLKPGGAHLDKYARISAVKTW